VFRYMSLKFNDSSSKEVTSQKNEGFENYGDSRLLWRAISNWVLCVC